MILLQSSITTEGIELSYYNQGEQHSTIVTHKKFDKFLQRQCLLETTVESFDGNYKQQTTTDDYGNFLNDWETWDQEHAFEKYIESII